MKYKYENRLNGEDREDLDELKKRFKSFGSLNPEASLPTADILSAGKTYKLYIGGKQARPDTQSSRGVYLNDTNKKPSLYCMIADASRKDVRNAVEAACSSFSGFFFFLVIKNLEILKILIN